MPNYVQNKMTITSPHIGQLWEAVKGKDSLLDFNRILRCRRPCRLNPAV